MNVVAAAAIESPALERSVRRKVEANSLATFSLKIREKKVRRDGGKDGYI